MPDRLRFRPVDKDTAKDFEAVFGTGGPNYCWCMAYRVTPEEAKAAPDGKSRKPLMLKRIADGVPVGLIGYLDDKPVAWVSVAPKETFRRLGGPDPEHGEKVWSLTCMFIRRELRGAGHGSEMIDAAIAAAKRHKADVLEAYPVDPDSPSYRFMGFLPAFKARDFTEIGMAGSRRHVMRLTLKAAHAGKA